MALTLNNFTLVFWIAVVPAFVAFALIVFAVKDPAPTNAGKERPRPRFAGIGRFSLAFWLVVAIAAVLTLARFSEAFLILRAQNLGMPIALAPVVLVVMNVVYALSAYPAGAASDRFGRTGVLALGIAALIAADLLLAFGGDLAIMLLGVVLWGLHMGLTQGLLATLVADMAPADLRGTAFGVFNLASRRRVAVGERRGRIAVGPLWPRAPRSWPAPRSAPRLWPDSRRFRGISRRGRHEAPFRRRIRHVNP